MKYIKKGIKRQHKIIEGILEILEEMSRINGVNKIIPAKIYSTKHISQPKIKFQKETISGFKLLAHSKGFIQEIFIVTDSSKRKEIEKILREKF